MPSNNMVQSDHDILLTFRAETSTQLKQLVADVKEVKDNIAARVTDLENEKVSKKDFAIYLEEHKVSHNELVKGQADHEVRIRKIENSNLADGAKKKGVSTVLTILLAIATFLLGSVVVPIISAYIQK